MYNVQIIPPGTLEFLKEREREREEKASSPNGIEAIQETIKLIAHLKKMTHVRCADNSAGDLGVPEGEGARAGGESSQRASVKSSDGTKQLLLNLSSVFVDYFIRARLRGASLGNRLSGNMDRS